MTLERRRMIEALLASQGGCTVESLARTCGVSDMTIRRDLEALSAAGKVVRTHGGAVPRDRVLFEFEFLNRSKINDVAKCQIAQTADKLVPDGSTLLMDSGTTTLALARALQDRKSLTVITTSLPVAATLQHAPSIRTILLGGVLQKDSPDLLGAITETNLESLRGDLAFIGADAIDLNGDVYHRSPDVARMLAKMAAAAAAVYVLADPSKIGKTALMRCGHLGQWRGLITNRDLPPVSQNSLAKAGVNVILADTSVTTISSADENDSCDSP